MQNQSSSTFTTLISVDQLTTLRTHSATHHLVILDARFDLAQTAAGHAAYRAAHIAGAHYVHLDEDLSASKTGKNGRHPLPDQTTFAHTIATLGITPNTQVVVYDDQSGMFAGRVWWMLRWLGHEAVAVLDGGWQAWLAAQGQTDSMTPARQPTTAAYPISANALTPITRQQMADNLQTRQWQLVDARAPDRFRGENEKTDPVGGHIPGALNRFFKDNLSDTGYFKPAAQLREEWLTLIAEKSPAQIVHSCGSGVTACHNILAMTHAGLAGSQLYAGSWSEWCAFPELPVERATE